MIRSFNGKTPKVAESAFISETAYVVGDVEIGENSSVWPGTVIRGDHGRIVIGHDTNVQDNSVIHGSVVIGNNVHIGHGAIINCHSIGDNVLIGMGATLIHDAEIGSMCIIGAACLVTRAMKIPDRSFVIGVPGEIKGQITEKQMWWVTGAPENYAELAREYKEAGL